MQKCTRKSFPGQANLQMPRNFLFRTGTGKSLTSPSDLQTSAPEDDAAGDAAGKLWTLYCGDLAGDDVMFGCLFFTGARQPGKLVGEESHSARMRPDI